MRNPIRTSILGIAVAALTLVPGTAAASTVVSPTSLSFSQQVGGTSPTQAVTLTKDCGGTLDPLDPVRCLLSGSVSYSPSISVTPGVFSQTNNCPVTLTATSGNPSSCIINVAFTPTAQNAVTGTLSTGMGGPTAALSGTGVTPSAGGVAGKAKKCKAKKKKKRASSAKKKKGCKKKKKKKRK